jgi:hypothetical protein
MFATDVKSPDTDTDYNDKAMLGYRGDSLYWLRFQCVRQESSRNVFEGRD